MIIIIIDDEAYIKKSLVILFLKFSAFLLTSLFDSEYLYTWIHVIEILHRTLVTQSIKDHYSDYFFYRDAVISAH